ncbi:MAG: sensor histidine kinase, partial [Alphaproteobacteria bacterium]
LERRAALAARLAAEEAANARLEARVAERTAELSRTNARLRREVRERAEAEAALRRAQDELVQAGKLSALGRLAAGISHELNQPLMAIGSFAENAALLLDAGRQEAARENLEEIGALARRAGRIIRNLRAFARGESEPPRRVDPAAVIGEVLALCRSRIAREGVEVELDLPAEPCPLRAGEVRLSQVLLNLVTNALDAMQGLPAGAARRIRIALEPGEDEALIRVADTGPGLADPERVFEPFYTTKEVGAAKGQGLGLAISYGIVQSFGGEIRGRNRPEGGAEFTIRLPRWREGEAREADATTAAGAGEGVA